MHKPDKVSIIIAVYKNIEALDLILDSLLQQSRVPDEIIIAEDGEFPEMKSFLEKRNISQLVHLTQEDAGWRKARSLNNAIKKATGDYLIFIDGDCLPHPRFIEGHTAISEPSFVVCGKRAELGENITKAIYSKKITPESITNAFIQNIIPLHKDGTRHYEEGIYISADNPLYSFLRKRHVRYMIGCNFSCYKKDF
jgi:glycosyltransferase involved in cell wall biosynthesis